jgi:hypothetical protein
MTAGESLAALRAARNELDAVIDEIRAVPGYEDFLATPTFDDVAPMAEEYPLVYVAAAEPGGFALVVRGTNVTHLPLGGLTGTALRRRVVAHMDMYAQYGTAPKINRARWNASLDEMTAWLWDEVMGPILDTLCDTTNLVIVAGGLLGLLPLHAAWTGDSTRVTARHYVLDDISVSYVPNARALRSARQLADAVRPSRLLAVADPSPVAGNSLPMARYEAMISSAGFVGSHTTLAKEEATFLSFEWEAPKADVLHLACHGFADLASPLDSGLLLAGGRITLARLLELRLRVRLAVLSACETGLPGIELPDEVVALPSGLLQAGVAGVVASQWSVPDRATAMLMAEFYRHWHWKRMTPATALRAAQCWLRDTTNAEKRAHFQAACDEHAEWLPPRVGQHFLDWLDLDRDGHGHKDIHSWGAFAHFGA